jgi:hypothetical protein
MLDPLSLLQAERVPYAVSNEDVSQLISSRYPALFWEEERVGNTESLFEKILKEKLDLGPALRIQLIFRSQIFDLVSDYRLEFVE